MFDAAQIMGGERTFVKSKCIIDYELKRKNHVFTFMNYASGNITQSVVSNALFDNGFTLADVSDTRLRQRDNSCWTLDFGIHSRNDVNNIIKWKSITFIDSRLWVSETKMLGSTRWKHPYTEMSNGDFNARCGHCQNTMDIVRRLIVIGSRLENTGSYKISKINKYGFMHIETDNGMAIQHLNNFDEVNPEEVKGVWFNEYLDLWTFENTDEVDIVPESYVYLLLDTHSKKQRFCAKDETGPVYTYDYTKARAFFSETEAIKYADKLNKRMHTTFTAEQWI